MNYRHAFHAGSFADVVKHAILTLLLLALRRKDKPFAVLDSHAGIGLYDLTADPAQRTGEFLQGIARLLAHPAPPPLVQPYLDIVRRANGGADTLAAYPGSPWIARALLRPQDRLVLVERHPEDVETLRRLFRGDRQVAVHSRDGYEALKALLPPAERRGLALIDPPFEVADEFRRLAAGLAAAIGRWPQGIYALWYPIKGRRAVDAFHGDLANTGIPAILVAELTVAEPAEAGPLVGTGLALVNPPWRLDAQLGELLPALQPILARQAGGVRLFWLVPEPG